MLRECAWRWLRHLISVHLNLNCLIDVEVGVHDCATRTMTIEAFMCTYLHAVQAAMTHRHRRRHQCDNNCPNERLDSTNKTIFLFIHSLRIGCGDALLAALLIENTQIAMQNEGLSSFTFRIWMLLSDDTRREMQRGETTTTKYHYHCIVDCVAFVKVIINHRGGRRRRCNVAHACKPFDADYDLGQI